MISILWMIVSFIIALMVLVAIHEYGHFIVARWLGVKVLRFSIGFGRVLLSWRDKKSTQYAISAIPLGGYVKMLDEREGPVHEDQLPYAFNRQPLWKRVAIVLAGPLFNIFFAILAYWLMFCIGITQVVPVIGDVAPNSIAQRAGLQAQQEIVAIAGESVTSWTDVRLKILAELGRDSTLPITTQAVGTNHRHLHLLDLSGWRLDGSDIPVLGSIGIYPDYPDQPAIIGSVVPDTPAAKIGLQPGDKILQLNQKTVVSWEDFVHNIAKHPRKKVTIKLERGTQTLSYTVLLDERTEGQRSIGYLGVQTVPTKWPAYLLRSLHYNPLVAIVPAIKTTWDIFILSWQMLGKMVVGNLSLKTVSGPIGIAQGAGYSASMGFSYFLNFLALISLSLAMVNLLPIPMLDGGHLLYFLIEAITRRPVSPRIQLVGMRVGITFLLAVMLLAFYNDLSRW